MLAAISPIDDQRILQEFWRLDKSDYLSVSDTMLFKISSQVHAVYQALMTPKFNGDMIQQSPRGYKAQYHTLLYNTSGTRGQLPFYLKITLNWELVKSL
jgi:hypothetical protein